MCRSIFLCLGVETSFGIFIRNSKSLITSLGYGTLRTPPRRLEGEPPTHSPFPILHHMRSRSFNSFSLHAKEFARLPLLSTSAAEAHHHRSRSTSPQVLPLTRLPKCVETELGESSTLHPCSVQFLHVLSSAEAADDDKRHPRLRLYVLPLLPHISLPCV
jgi:hypothetical protein